MIKNFDEFKILKFGLFDWDDNLLYMSTTVHLDRYVHGEWVAVDIPASQFNKYISNEKTRMRNNNFKETFLEQTDVGPRGDKSFLLDTIKAIKHGHFGPSWDDFIQSLVDGRIFLIITARGHEPSSMRKAVEWIIYNYLSEEQRYKMEKNLIRFHELFGENPDNIIDHYLDNCDYVGVMSDYFKRNFNLPEMKISKLVGLGKSLVIKRFINRIKQYSKASGIPAKVGFSDDRKRTIDDVTEFLSGEKSLDDPIEYYVFDTSGKEKKKIKI